MKHKLAWCDASEWRKSHTIFCLLSLAFYYHSIDKLNPRLIWIAPLYNLLFIHCFFSPLHTIKSNNSFFSTAAATKCEHHKLSSACLPMRGQREIKIYCVGTKLIISISDRILASFTIMLTILTKTSDSCSASCLLALVGLWLHRTLQIFPDVGMST